MSRRIVQTTWRMPPARQAALLVLVDFAIKSPTVSDLVEVQSGAFIF